MLSSEETSKRLLTSFSHNAFPYPLPKLRLCRPKLFPIPANHQSRLLLAFLFLVGVNGCWFICAHADTPLSARLPKHEKRPNTVPLREASLARQQQVVKSELRNCAMIFSLTWLS